MKKNGVIHLLLMCAAFLCLSSCSGGSGGLNQGDTTNPAGSLTSQMVVTVDRAEASEFVTDLGYSVALSRAVIHISRIEVGGSQGEETGDVHEHGVPLLREQCSPRHEEAPAGGDTGALLEGQWAINLFSGNVTLGVAQANPGTYSALSFFLGHGSHSHSAQDSVEAAEEEVHDASVEIEGAATENAIDYPFCVHIHGDEAVACSGLSIDFVFGHYLPVHISFHVGHWLNDVDFQALAARDGVIYINDGENTGAYDIIKAQVTSHVHVRTSNE